MTFFFHQLFQFFFFVITHPHTQYTLFPILCLTIAQRIFLIFFLALLDGCQSSEPPVRGFQHHALMTSYLVKKSKKDTPFPSLFHERTEHESLRHNTYLVKSESERSEGKRRMCFRIVLTLHLVLS
ncbi:hypothetical protein F5X96DRAFT_648514 [Biscogniauxia mediterranea]|nr:hypothetical protein F5X96DRAFT_648514 [Biscogniauxia mediterranea]